MTVSFSVVKIFEHTLISRFSIWLSLFFPFLNVIPIPILCRYSSQLTEWRPWIHSSCPAVRLSPQLWRLISLHMSCRFVACGWWLLNAAYSFPAMFLCRSTLFFFFHLRSSLLMDGLANLRMGWVWSCRFNASLIFTRLHGCPVVLLDQTTLSYFHFPILCRDCTADTTSLV